METIRIDLKTSKHFWFNYSFVHCAQRSMYSGHFKIKNGAFSKFLIPHEIARNCGQLLPFLFVLPTGTKDSGNRLGGLG